MNYFCFSEKNDRLVRPYKTVVFLNYQRIDTARLRAYELSLIEVSRTDNACVIAERAFADYCLLVVVLCVAFTLNV